MTDTVSTVLSSIDRRQEDSARIMEKIFAAAQPGAVFGQPVVSGNYTVITASEVMSGGGFGYGAGIGPTQAKTPSGEAGEASGERMAGGSGGGGGGGSSARPVAAIVIGPDGVTVRPVVDVTKVAIAVITAWGAAIAILSRMRRAGKG